LPDKVAMLTTFAITGSVPLFMMFRILTGKRKQGRLRSEGLPDVSVQTGVGKINHDDSGKN
jgi:hypothetical protein